MAKRFPLEIIIGATDRASAALRKVTDRVERFYQPFGRLRQAFSNFANKTGLTAVGEALGNVARSAWDVTRRVVLGFTAAATAVGLFTYRQAMAADQIGDTAARLNISTRALQAYTYGFNQADVAPEALTSALGTLNKNLGDAKIGMGKAIPLFRGLGIDPKKFKTIDQLLPVLADRLSRINDPTKRAAIAQRLLGDAGADMALKLGQGPKALAEMMEAARKAGAVIDDSVIESAGVLDARLKALRGTFAGVAGNALGKLYPALSKLAERLSAFLVDHADDIERWAKDFGEKLPDRIERATQALRDLRDTLSPVTDLIGRVVDKFGVGNTIMIAFSAIIGAKLIGAVLTLGTALAGLGVSTAVAFGAPALIIAAIAAVVVAGWWLYKNWDTVSMKIGDSIDWVVDKFSTAWNWIKNAGAAAFDYIADKLKYNPLFLVLRGMSWIAGQIATGGASAPPASAAPIGGALMAPGAGVMRQQVDVRVDLSNLPPGTRTRATASDGVQLDLSRGFAMPGVP